MGEGLLSSRLAEDSQTRHIPFILTSARYRRGDVVAALESGADAVLARPLDYAEVAANARALIRRARLKPALNPLTGLPGTPIIEQEIRQLVTPGWSRSCWNTSMT